MSWLQEVLDRLETRPCCGYDSDSPPATEPTALAALALWGHGRSSAAETALEWLATVQLATGCVPIDGSHDGPGWATGWAVLAWHRALIERPVTGSDGSGEESHRSTGAGSWALARDRAIAWILATKGRALGQSPLLGHDMSLQAWAWADGSASWVEPTAIQLLALKTAGYGPHARCREAVRLLRDRAIPSGGWNCGNKTVFGTALRPQVQSTGLALAALAGEPDAGPEVRRAIDYLHKTLSPSTTLVSLAYALIGLTCHGERTKEADSWLASATERSLREEVRPCAWALAALAGGGWRVTGGGSSVANRAV